MNKEQFLEMVLEEVGESSSSRGMESVVNGGEARQWSGVSVDQRDEAFVAAKKREASVEDSGLCDFLARG